MKKIISIILKVLISKIFKNSEAQIMLKKLEGKVIHFLLTDFHYSFIYLCKDGFMEELPGDEEREDLKIKISLRDIIRVFRRKTSLEYLFFDHRIKIEGNFGVYSPLKDIFYP
ncbi:MAG: SCP2 sterol-binding domain-containing protein [Actinomycetia bacterium]|nr:SCP2 sterol-binding domain-containing protein [Actinomycetes bacterium]